ARSERSVTIHRAERCWANSAPPHAITPVRSLRRTLPCTARGRSRAHDKPAEGQILGGRARSTKIFLNTRGLNHLAWRAVQDSQTGRELRALLHRWRSRSTVGRPRWECSRE